MSVCFFSNNIKKSIEFYTQILGLELDFVNGDRFVNFRFNNGVYLAIKKSSEDREVPGHQTLFIDEPEVEERFKEMKSKGCIFKKELTEETYGTHFSVFDPDKNKLEFIRNKN